MIKEIFLFLFFFIFYIFIYTYLKINKNNELYLFNHEQTRYNINKETYLKLPFYFDGTHLNQKIDKTNMILLETNDKYVKYQKNYEQIHLLEPYIKFFPHNYIYTIKTKQYIPLHKNDCQTNFYFIKKGICNITLIHPKYKDNFYKNGELITNSKIINYLKQNTSFQRIKVYKNTLLYIPNYWLIFIENNSSKSSIVECIHYNNLIDSLFQKKVFNK